MLRKLTIATGTLLMAAASLLVSTPASADTPGTTPGPCQYTATPDEPAARPVPLPPDPKRTPNRGHVRVDVHTNQGALPLTLDRAKAPCTVQSFIHLARWKFYDRTTCHRLTTYPTLEVLQCGDPSGTGEGGPGYRYKDELPVDLEPAPTDPTGARKIYPRGTLAMANAGPDTNGSQFFVTVAETPWLNGKHTIFGQVTDGYDVVEAISKLPTRAQDRPVDDVVIERIEITG